MDSMVVGVRDDQRELGTSVPTLTQVGVGMVKVNGDDFIWKAERQEIYLPGSVFRWGGCETEGTHHLCPPQLNSGLVSLFSSFFQPWALQ